MRFVSLLLCSFFTLLLKAQSEKDKTVLPFPMKEQALLWKIEGKQLIHPSYLFGTMHLIEKEYFFFPEKLKRQVEKSEQLVMELPGLPNQEEVLKYVQLSEGSFFDYFTPQQTDSILQWAKSILHMSEAQFRGIINEMKPFVAVQLATQMYFLGKTESYEITLENLAKENRIEIKGLETIGEQMSLFDDLSDTEQAEMVMQIVRKPEITYAETSELEKLYIRQNIDSLYLFIVNSESSIKSDNLRFIDNRNSKWIPLIEDFIKQKQTFIAVGAGHLGGPNGLVRLLQQKGYELTPVKL